MTALDSSRQLRTVKHYLKWWVVLFAVLIALSILIITLGRGDTPKNREIANDLLEINRHSEYARERAALESITNLFHGKMNFVYFIDAPALLYRRYDLRITRLHEIYSIESSPTNSSEWILHHYWDWNGHRLLNRKLLTFVETNTARPNP